MSLSTEILYIIEPSLRSLNDDCTQAMAIL